MGMSGTPRRDLTWSPGGIDVGMKVAILGGTGGIGRALARRFAEDGADVTVVGRTFRDDGVRRVSFLEAELQSMKEAQRVAAELPAETLDLVLFTTGIFAGPERRATVEGIEEDLAVSYLNRFVALKDLAPRLGRDRKNQRRKPRVFVMGFPGTGEIGNVNDMNSEQQYRSMLTHMTTVAANEALVVDAAHRYPDLLVFGLNPGLIKTNIRSNVLGGAGSLKFRLVEGLIGLLTPTPTKYAARIVPLLMSPDLEQHSGALFNAKAKPIMRSPQLTDELVARYRSGSESLAERALAA